MISRRRFLAGSAGAIGAAVILEAVTGRRASGAATVEWASDRTYRILLEVPPSDIGKRAQDERPAAVELDFEQILAQAGIHQIADLSTLQIMRYDPRDGKPIPYKNNLFAETPHDLPLQWYDAAIPDPFPDHDSAATDTPVSRPYWGYYYEVIGDWKRGRLAWTHTQERNRTSYYAAYFNLLPTGGKQTMPPPRGWIGDGAYRTAKVGTHSTGLYHVNAKMVDFNGDGLPDLVCGCSRGGVLWYENLGTKQEPRFSVARLLFQSDGKPIDIGFLSTPTVTDWDGDGKLDLLIGANGGIVYFYKNVGTNAAPVYENRGLIQSDGKPLRTPVAPVPEVEGPHGEPIYKEGVPDYEPFVEVVDWDGDGRLDLLIGGYVTGRIFWYRNTGTGPDGLPILTLKGPLEADGKPIDVGWAANPTVADINGDGKLDLITNVWKKAGNESPSPVICEDFLAYYENIGTRTEPVLTMKVLPRVGEFPKKEINCPTLIDWNGDGILDLCVSNYQMGEIYLFKNIGDRTHPKFDTRNPVPLTMPWGNDPLPLYAQDSSACLDWNGDGLPDIVGGSSFLSAGAQNVYLNTGEGLPWRFKYPIPIPTPDQVIDHRAWKGDDWAYYCLVDFDGDGRTDILFGDFYGQVWFHRNISTSGDMRFDTKGVLITLPDGKPIRVGPAADAAFDFTVLQGSRLHVMAADFDGNGSVDLLLSDTYGKYYFCKRGKYGKEPVVESQTLIHQFPSRGNNCIADWDGDGRKDLLVSTGTGYHWLRNNGGWGDSPFDKPQALNLPLIPVRGSEIGVFVQDMNGDGDQDVILATDHGYHCFFERSFLNSGYAKAGQGAFQVRK